MLSVYGCKALGSLNRFEFSANTHSLTLPKHPPVPVSHDVTGLLSFSQSVSFRFVFGLPAEALPPSAAIRLRSSALSFLLRASPALRAISERRSGLNFSVLALPPSFPRARACGFLCFIAITLAKRHVCVKQNVSPSTADEPTSYSDQEIPRRTEHTFRDAHAGSDRNIWSGPVLEPKIQELATSWQVFPPSAPRKIAHRSP